MKISPIAFLILAVSFIGACNRSPQDQVSNQDYEALKKSPVTCGAPAQAEIRPWGKAGQSYGCYIRSGPFVVAEDGYVHLRGQFKEGKKIGVWRWYNMQGNVINEIDYSAEQAK